jgi:AhpD family alkylhydroperoxidase
MEARLPNPTALLPDAVPAIQQLIKAAHAGGAPETVLELVHLRASQINGCSFCVDYGWRTGRASGIPEEKLFGVAAWREMPYFDDAERAALDLAEHATRLADNGDPVPDHVWNDAARHFNDEQLASIVLWIAVTNMFNRVNATLRQPAGQLG